MEQTWLHLLSISGLLSLTLCEPHEYVLIKEKVTWVKAQEYCRKNHIDLATVQSEEDWTNLQEVAEKEGHLGNAWFGLYNDINSWRWSYQEESLLFTSWETGQPDNRGSGQECAAITSDGGWRDRPCDGTRSFLCSNRSTNATEKMVLITTTKTWLDAQTYCRQHYTDLLTIRSLEDNKQAASLLNFLHEPWIGLYRDDWKWSDQANFTSSTQLAAQNLNGENENCAVINYNRYIDDNYCTGLYYFYCSTVKKKQVIRVQVKASENADDATLRALVLHKLQQMLINQDVTWKKQPDGKVFQKKKNEEKKTSNAVINAELCSSME